MAVDERRRSNGKPRRTNSPLPQYDQELRQAKNEGKLVTFILAVETPYTDDDCAVSGTVEFVDKFEVKLYTSGADRRNVWFKKSAIVCTEIS